MAYLLLFTEGILTFISPCLLPMLPIYITYFAGGNSEQKGKAFINALGFSAGFTLIFVLLGVFASFFGDFVKSTAFHIIGGGILILFGLNYTGILRLPLMNITKRMKFRESRMGFFSAFMFGLVFSMSWTPCISPFLGSALLLAASSDTVLQGITMILTFSLGLAIPFVLSAVLLDSLKNAFAFIKRNYRIINIISGSLLIIMGIIMATGLMGTFLRIFTF